MVWLAAASSTAILGYILYRFLSVSAPSLETKCLTLDDGSDRQPPIENGRPPDNFKEPAIDEASPISLTAAGQAKDGVKNDTSLSKTLENGLHQEPTPKSKLQAPTIAPPSIQSHSPPRLKGPSFSKMQAPPRPGGSALRPPPSAAASLRVPVTKVLSNTSMAPTSSIMPQNGRPSRKVILQPGHSPLDWAMLTKSPDSKLRGRDVPDHYIRVTPSQLKYHNGRKGRDAWSIYQGKVYNITPYLPFHPGGEGELMRGAAKDAGQLFMEVHPWVNWDNMLSECMIGILVAEGEEKDDEPGGLDEMD